MGRLAERVQNFWGHREIIVDSDTYDPAGIAFVSSSPEGSSNVPPELEHRHASMALNLASAIRANRTKIPPQPLDADVDVLGALNELRQASQEVRVALGMQHSPVQTPDITITSPEELGY